MTAPLYPVFLRLAGLPVVLVGGGAVAASKLDGCSPPARRHGRRAARRFEVATGEGECAA